MAVVYDIEHSTSYKYKNPVTLASTGHCSSSRRPRRARPQLLDNDQRAFQDSLDHGRALQQRGAARVR
jgi:hypothetical protein